MQGGRPVLILRWFDFMRISSLRGDRAFLRKLTTLTIPIALQSLLLASVSAADAFMLGRLDQNSMAAVSLATQVQFIMTMFIMADTSTGSVLASQYYGRKDGQTVGDIFNMMLRSMTVIDVMFWALCCFSPRPLMLFFTNDPVLIDIGCRYLRIAGWSYLLVGFSQCYHTVMKIPGHARMSMWISLASVMSNIILNAVLIFGLFGAPALGPEGAAIATLISRVIELAWCVLVSMRKDYIRPNLERLLYYRKELVIDSLKIAAPVLGSALLWGIGFTSYTAIVAHMGSDAAAANSIASVVRDLICSLCNGVATAGGIILGIELGAGEMETARTDGRRLRDLSFVIGILSMMVLLALTPAVVHLMKLTPEAKSYLTGMMVIQAVYMIGRCVNTVTINGVFYTGGDAIFDTYSLIVMMWCIAIPAALLGAFVFHWPVLVVYSCTCVDEVGKIPWVMIHFRKYKWLKNLTRD